MRHNYYEPAGWPQSPEEGRGRWEPGDAPEPYGEVPGEVPPAPRPEPGQSGPRQTPSAWRKPPRRPQPKRHMGIFALFLAGILLLTGAAVALERLDWTLPGWGYSEPGAEGEDWGGEPALTTVERAPVGDGTVLAISDTAGEILSPQAVYEKVSPSVVGVRATLTSGTALGTGVIMSPDGYIITNAHVVEGSSRVDVVFSDDARRKALLVGMDEDMDLAVLKVEARDLPVAEFGDSAALRVGDTAYAIGNPLGEELRGTMTDGIISAIDRTVTVDGKDMTLVQTTAALNSGNSGGALVNAGGQVVGITNMKMMSYWDTIEGLGFAIPTASAKPVVDQIIDKGYYPGRPALGVTVRNQTAYEGQPAGAYVENVERKSDAYAQGIRSGNVIVRANGVLVSTIDDLEKAKEDLQVGDTMTLEVWTGRGTRMVEVKLMDRHAFEQ